MLAAPESPNSIGVVVDERKIRVSNCSSPRQDDNRAPKYSRVRWKTARPLTTGSGSSDYCANRETVCRILDMLAVIQPDTRTRIPRETDTNAINLLVLCRQASPYASLQSGMTETIHVHSV